MYVLEGKFGYPNATFSTTIITWTSPGSKSGFAVRSRKKLKLMYISIRIYFVPHRENLLFPA
jgi:hypothetical protein